MKKMNLVSVVLFTTLLTYQTIPALAGNQKVTIDLDDSTVYYLQSNGRNDASVTQSGETENSTNTSSSAQETQSQKNARESRSSVVSILNEWKNQVKNTDTYCSYFFNSSQYDISNVSFSSVRADKVNSLIKAVEQLKTDLNNGASEYNYNSVAKMGNTSVSSDYDTMTDQEKKQIKQEIVKQNHSDAAIIDGEIKLVNENNTDYRIQGTVNGLVLNNPAYNDISKYIYINPGALVLKYCYKGYPALNDMENDYVSRFNGLISKANDSGWNDSTSVYLDDSITISLLTDYHVYSAKKDYVVQTSYINNERRWTITLNGEALDSPLITDDPRHELNFTNVYKEYGAGEYHIVAEQLADVQRATFVQYEIGEYLYETDTGNILWFSESRVTGNGGGSIFLNSVTTQEWVETDDTFDITINNLGEIEKDGSATQREE